LILENRTRRKPKDQDSSHYPHMVKIAVKDGRGTEGIPPDLLRLVSEEISSRKEERWLGGLSDSRNVR